ncbi:hypothetical protein AAJ76_320008997 [Vairimorpha ceranae]|uniref:Uncharacterized protein n=1 Tax=Vairimorpha ceranae TaxID=40302 RepID=A0A0F9ZBN1_9MICR|nr:hypothetical protein AAJ76_320008997 [Vairimorpha ceranae]KKO75099.1 hypothetical protein AAJ76_320008997 [Vairimorpha ceranae]
MENKNLNHHFIRQPKAEMGRITYKRKIINKILLKLKVLLNCIWDKNVSSLGKTHMKKVFLFNPFYILFFFVLSIHYFILLLKNSHFLNLNICTLSVLLYHEGFARRKI